jgi:hypothetical protein
VLRLNISAPEIDIKFDGFQIGMAQDFLQTEWVATVKKILLSKGVAEDMGRTPLAIDASRLGTSGDHRLYSPGA